MSEGLLNRDECTYREIIDTHGRLVWAVCSAILKNAGTCEDVEECVADVFIELWQAPHKWNPEKGGIEMYLKLVARSKALNLHRKLKSKPLTLTYDDAFSETAETSETLESEVLGRIGESEIMGKIAGLKEPDREIFYRRHCFEQKPREIARSMNLPEREVRNRLYQSKKKLQAIITNGGNCYET
jgi:RNA polymerase sigma-70 factor (ECF subfamily)